MTTDEVLLGVGLIVALAVGSQVLASRLRIPAIILLLPAGFTAGAWAKTRRAGRAVAAASPPARNWRRPIQQPQENKAMVRPPSVLRHAAHATRRR